MQGHAGWFQLNGSLQSDFLCSSLYARQPLSLLTIDSLDHHVSAGEPFFHPVAADHDPVERSRQDEHLGQRASGYDRKHGIRALVNALKGAGDARIRVCLHALDAERGQGPVIIQGQELVFVTGQNIPEVRQSDDLWPLLFPPGSHNSSILSWVSLATAKIRVRYSRRWRVMRKFSRTNSRAF